MPRVELAEPGAPVPAASPSVRQPAPHGGKAPATGQFVQSAAGASASTPDVSPDERIAALSAVPAAAPSDAPRRGEARMTAFETLTAWSDVVVDYARIHWRQIGSVTAMVVLAGLLFWRLGERSRHSEQELVLDVRAPFRKPEAEELGGDEAALAQEPDATEFSMAFVDSPPAPAAISMLGEETPSEPAPPPIRQHATLHEAIAAMKAEMARNRSSVDA